jgi:hypothetical protein
MIRLYIQYYCTCIRTLTGAPLALTDTDRTDRTDRQCGTRQPRPDAQIHHIIISINTAYHPILRC